VAVVILSADRARFLARVRVRFMQEEANGVGRVDAEDASIIKPKWEAVVDVRSPIRRVVVLNEVVHNEVAGVDVVDLSSKEVVLNNEVATEQHAAT
jgi:hypothetical protein